MLKLSQMLRQLLTTLSITLAILSSAVVVVALTSCTQIQVKNSPWYGDKGSLGAHWVDLFDANTGDIPKAQWDVLRFGMVCSSADNLENLLTDIEKMCDTQQTCTIEQEAVLRKNMHDLHRFRMEFHHP